METNHWETDGLNVDRWSELACKAIIKHTVATASDHRYHTVENLATLYISIESIVQILPQQTTTL